MHFLCTLFIFPLLIATQARVLVEDPSSLVESLVSNVPPLHEDAVQVTDPSKEEEKLTYYGPTIEHISRTIEEDIEVDSDKVDSEVKSEPSNDIFTEAPEINQIPSEDASQSRGLFGVGNRNQGNYQQIALSYDFPAQSDTEKIFKFPFKVVAIQPPATTTTTTTTTTPKPSNSASTTTTTTTTPAPILYKPIKPFFFSPFLKPIALAPTTSTSSSSSTGNAYNNNYYGLGLMLMPKPFLFKSGASLLGERSVSDSAEDSFNLNGADGKNELDVLKVCMFLDTNLIKQILKEKSDVNELSPESEAMTPEEQFETQPNFEQETGELQNEQVKEEVNEPPKEVENQNEQVKEEVNESPREVDNQKEQFEEEVNESPKEVENQKEQVKEELIEQPKKIEAQNQQVKEEVNEPPKEIQNQESEINNKII